MVKKKENCWNKSPRKDFEEKFNSLISKEAVEVISKWVAKISGDIWVAFDILKTSLQKKVVLLKNNLKDPEYNAKEDANLKLSLPDIVSIIKEKYESKLVENLKNIPPLTILVLKTISHILTSSTEVLNFNRLYMEHWKVAS